MSYQHKRFHQSPIVEIGKYLEPRRDSKGNLVLNREGKAKPAPCLSSEVNNRFSIAGKDDYVSLKPVLIKRQSQAVQINGKDLASRCNAQTVRLKPSFINSDARAVHYSELHPALIFLHECAHKRTSAQAHDLSAQGLCEAYPPTTEVRSKAGQDGRIERFARKQAERKAFSPRVNLRHLITCTLKTGR